jgi:general secretion pathway protein C
MKHRWVFNLLVVALMSYFLWPAIENLWKIKRAPNPVTEPERISRTTEPASTVRPLEEYSIIAERNLFGSSKEEDSTPKEEVSLEGIPVAVTSLGLKLVGTVVTDEPKMNLAIIANKSTRKQETYHEGDRIGKVLVKKIVRDNVIINTGRGDEVLTMKYEGGAGTPRKTKTTTKNRRGLMKKSPLRRAPGSKSAASRFGSINLKRQEVESAFADINKLMQEVRISPYKEGKQPSGFQISDIKPGSIFSKMGLRNGDVIKGVNDKAITSPEQAIEFYQSLTEGGKIAVEIKRGKTNKKLRLLVE